LKGVRMACNRFLSAGLLVAFALECTFSAAQLPAQYQPTISSLNAHPLPQWYAGAKLGIFIHYGLYSVPGWAPLSHPEHDFQNVDYIKNDPYAEWYLNAMRIPGSPTQAYHRAHYGANFGYYDFVPIFNRESRKWNPNEWATVFRQAGARYVVLTTKHHDGFTLWPTITPNPSPTLPLGRQHAERDIVGELTAAVRKQGLRMGLYYSGGYDWTFNTGPILTSADYQEVKPETQAYGNYAFAQIHELIERYHPSVLWNDIDWPKTGNALQVEADYYNSIPDGAIDDRFGIPHADFTSPEFEELKQYNRAEGESETIAPADLIALLVDIVSKNGNLLLDVGPEADGTIPPVQMERLQALGAWLKQNGEAIYDTIPWTHATGKSQEGDDLRFTRKGDDLYVTILGTPKEKTVTLTDLGQGVLDRVHGTGKVYLLGDPKSLNWSTGDGAVEVKLPDKLPGSYAYVLKLNDYAR
jgi:alpha-L-fucosidase